LLVHTAVLLSPRLIHMNYFPKHLFESVFVFTSKEVAIACRIMLLDKYGMLFGTLLKDWGVTLHKDINNILTAMDSIESSKEITGTVLKVEFDDKLIGPDPILDENCFEEIELARVILVAAADTSVVISTKEEIPKEIYKKGWLGFLKDFICDVFNGKGKRRKNGSNCR